MKIKRTEHHEKTAFIRLRMIHNDIMVLASKYHARYVFHDSTPTPILQRPSHSPSKQNTHSLSNPSAIISPFHLLNFFPFLSLGTASPSPFALNASTNVHAPAPTNPGPSYSLTTPTFSRLIISLTRALFAYSYAPRSSRKGLKPSPQSRVPVPLSRCAIPEMQEY